MKRPKSSVRRINWPATNAAPLVTPLQPSVVYAARDPDALDAQYKNGNGYSYAREGHPNADVLAAKIDLLEQTSGGIITSSGMAAISAAVLGVLRAGDHLIGGDQLYGRSLRMLNHDLPRLGIETSLVDPTCAELLASAIRPNTKMMLVEVISNPTLRIADMHSIVALCRDRGIVLVVDNTFTTPLLYQPIVQGADIVVHSVTKLLAGHSDATLGYISATDPERGQAIREACVTWGLTPSPFDCWLAERGVHSFELRFERAQSNAAILADALASCCGVKRVIYPGRTDHPDYILGQSILTGQGGNMLSLELHGGRDAANAFTQAATNIAFAPTLGDVSTTLSHPVTSSHRKLSEKARASLGISEGFFRVSVGIEDPDLLVSEFTQAAQAALL